ncbi:MAG TPA: hydroxyisourate hydrolase [Thermoanaerobaculia bacterium]|jgi:5-hydroxyisourate hydrolase|nr:hydroxyisourate hydrolase [Thermoanaerobaculia bacterium]
MSGISTHVLDTSTGRPAAGVAVRLELEHGAERRELARATTDVDGRVPQLLPAGTPLAAATYRLTFDTGAYFGVRGAPAFYPQVMVVFTVRDAGQHHHVPLLLSPFGYSTYRGS